MNATNIRDFFYDIDTKLIHIRANIYYYLFLKRKVDKIHAKRELEHRYRTDVVALIH